MHSVFNGTCPAYLSNIVEPIGAGRTRPRLRSTSTTDFSMPWLRTKFSERSFSQKWNLSPFWCFQRHLRVLQLHYLYCITTRQNYCHRCILSRKMHKTVKIHCNALSPNYRRTNKTVASFECPVLTDSKHSLLQVAGHFSRNRVGNIFARQFLILFKRCPQLWITPTNTFFNIIATQNWHISKTMQRVYYNGTEDPSNYLAKF